MAREIQLEAVEPQLVGATEVGYATNAPGLRYRNGVLPASQEDSDDEVASVTQEFPTEEERRLSLFLVLASVADLVCSFCIVVVAFRFAARSDSASLYSVGIQAGSHWSSSLLLALRFTGELKLPLPSENVSSGLLRKRRRRFLVREQVVSIIVGLLMLCSVAGLLFMAFRKINMWNKWYEDHSNLDAETRWALEFLAWYGFSFYFLQAIGRAVLGCKLRRSLVWHCFCASVVSVLFLLIIGIAGAQMQEWSWKAEPVAAIGLAFVTLIEAVRIIIMWLDDMDDRLKVDSRA